MGERCDNCAELTKQLDFLKGRLFASDEDAGRLQSRLRIARDALQYAGIGQERPFNQLEVVIEERLGKCRNPDNSDYWRLVLEKLRLAAKAAS